ncbi:hypothetical protein ACORG1_13485 [Mycobacterium sp. TJFP1]|jgi:hypothetical protein
MTNSLDALKYAAALLTQRANWTTDSISGADCTGDHEPELDAIDETAREICALAAQFGDPRRYSDGRMVKSAREIEPGVVTEHVWHPDPAAEKPLSWRGTLRHDPGEPCPGIYEVSLTPATQEIHVCTVRSI